MRARRTSSPERRSACPISIALELVGDPWSLLVVRDLAFKGAESFRDLLEGGEGIATNVLADRLRRLEEFGIIDKRRDARDGRRYLYRLTERGIDLAPALVELIIWSDKYEQTAAPPGPVREMRLRRGRYLRAVREAWEQT